MKKTGILILAISLISMGFNFKNQSIKDVPLKVDITNSTIHWSGYKPTGSHTGTVELQAGTISLDGNKITGGNFTVDMHSIKDSDGSEKLEKHLKSKDFFEVVVFPTATFELTHTANKNGKTYITGNLTVKNNTKQITFPASISVTDSSITLTSEVFKINRADFNVRYKSKSFFNNLKEKFINDEFDLKVKIVANL